MKRDSSGVWRELNRFDIRSREPLTATANRSLAEHLREVFSICDGLIVLDQINETNWGVVNDQTQRVLRELVQESPDKLMFIDSRAHLGAFDFGVLKGNRTELLSAVGEPANSDLPVDRAAAQLAAKTGERVYATIGEAGILIANPDGKLTRSAGLRVDGPVDIVGAGDSATSGIVASLLSGSDPAEAADVGNLVASITVQQLGTTGTASPAQVLVRHAEL